MSGIRIKNLAEGSALARNLHYGVDCWLPPSDDRMIAQPVSMTNATGDADFTLDTTFSANGGQLAWPQKIYVVMHNNRPGYQGFPGVQQAGPNISGATNGFTVTVVGKLNGNPVTEEILVSVAGGLSSPTGYQWQCAVSDSLFDEITSVSHSRKTGTWGTNIALTVSVGTGVSQLGIGSALRQSIHSPIVPVNSNYIRGMYVPDLDQYHARGTGLTGVTVPSSSGTMSAPSRGRYPGPLTHVGPVPVTSTAAARVFTLANHGLRDGDVVFVRTYTDGLPLAYATGTELLSPKTPYMAVVLSSSTFMLTSTLLPPMAVRVTDHTTDTISNCLTTGTAWATVTPLPVSPYFIAGTPVILRRATVGGSLFAYPANGSAVADNTVYFVKSVNQAAGTFVLEATVGGVQINWTANNEAGPSPAADGFYLIPCHGLGVTGNFATGENIDLWRPARTYERARLLYNDGPNVEKMT